MAVVYVPMYFKCKICFTVYTGETKINEYIYIYKPVAAQLPPIWYKATLFYSGACIVGPQNAPLHNMLLLVAYCVPCIHNMLRWSILCTLHTQYATSGAYCVGSIHMLFQWSSEGTQHALLENMSRGICLSF